MKNIIECIQGFATPMNTLGMGEVNPLSEPIGNVSKTKRKNKRKKRKMKSLRDFLVKESIVNEKLKITVDKTIEYEPTVVDWDIKNLEHVLSFFFNDINDVDLFLSNYTNKIEEYVLSFEYENFDGLKNTKDGRKFKDVDFEAEDFEELFGSLDYGDTQNIYWYDGGNGIRTIIFEAFIDGSLYYNILGDKDLKSVLEALPGDLGRLDDDRSLLQAYEINTK